MQSTCFMSTTDPPTGRRVTKCTVRRGVVARVGRSGSKEVLPNITSPWAFQVKGWKEDRSLDGVESRCFSDPKEDGGMDFGWTSFGKGFGGNAKGG